MFKNKIYKILSKEDLEKISNEIKKVENNTSAEVVVSIKNNIPFIFFNNIYKFALSLFNFYEVHKTKNKTGILILFILKRKQFYILADSGIYKKVDRSFFEDLSVSISNKIKGNTLVDGILLSINESANLVNKYFPKLSDDIDEIDNSVKF